MRGNERKDGREEKREGGSDASSGILSEEVKVISEDDYEILCNGCDLAEVRLIIATTFTGVCTRMKDFDVVKHRSLVCLHGQLAAH